MEEFGSTAMEKAEDEDEEKTTKKTTAKGPKETAKFMLDEERELGAVSWRIYSKYFKAMNSWWRPWFALVVYLAVQGCTVGNTLFLGFWSGKEIKGFEQGDYMAIYAGEFSFRWIDSWSFLLMGN